MSEIVIKHHHLPAIAFGYPRRNKHVGVVVAVVVEVGYWRMLW